MPSGLEKIYPEAKSFITKESLNNAASQLKPEDLEKQKQDALEQVNSGDVQDTESTPDSTSEKPVELNFSAPVDTNKIQDNLKNIPNVVNEDDYYNYLTALGVYASTILADKINVSTSLISSIGSFGTTLKRNVLGDDTQDAIIAIVVSKYAMDFVKTNKSIDDFNNPFAGVQKTPFEEMVFKKYNDVILRNTKNYIQTILQNKQDGEQAFYIHNDKVADPTNANAVKQWCSSFLRTYKMNAINFNTVLIPTPVVRLCNDLFKRALAALDRTVSKEPKWNTNPASRFTMAIIMRYAKTFEKLLDYQDQTKCKRITGLLTGEKNAIEGSYAVGVALDQPLDTLYAACNTKFSVMGVTTPKGLRCRRLVDAKSKLNNKFDSVTCKKKTIGGKRRQKMTKKRRKRNVTKKRKMKGGDAESLGAVGAAFFLIGLLLTASPTTAPVGNVFMALGILLICMSLPFPGCFFFFAL
jgi:hypothetical protein